LQEKALAFPKQGTIRKKGLDYRQFKYRVHELDGWKCRRCFCIVPLTVHHIVKRSKLRLDTVENCVSLCFDCHDEVERNNIRLGWVDLGKRILVEES